jgi:tetratricopeptide (TPR) repeat protein
MGNGMRIPPRVYIPAVLALVIVAGVGAVLIWQIRASVNVIEMAFNGVKQAQQSIFTPSANRDAGGQNQSEALMHLRQGEIFERRGEWRQAQDAYLLSVNAGGGAPALRKLIRIQLQRREYDAAGDSIGKLRKETRETDDIMLLSGLLQLRTGKIDAARSTFSARPETPQAQYGLALVALAGRDIDGAQQQLKLAAQNSDATIRSYATTLMAAFKEFSLFAEGQETHLDTLLARALAQVGECETALTYVNKVTAKQDRYRDAWIVKGYCEFTTERLQDALASLERAYSIDPEKPETQYFLARTHAAMGDPQNAVTFLQYAVLNGFSPAKDARDLLAQYALELGDTDLALEQYRTIAEDPASEPEDYEKYVNLALQLPNRANEAYQAAKDAQAKWPDDALPFVMLGKAAGALGAKDEAEKALREALRIDPKFTKATEELGALLTGKSSSATTSSTSSSK